MAAWSPEYAGRICEESSVMRTLVSCRCVVLLAAMAAGQGHAADAVTLENVPDPGPNRRDEPLAKEFSLDKAVGFLDAAALNWQKERKCFTCHTNYAHLYARPLVSADAPAAKEVRRFAEELIEKRWVESG